MTKNKSIRILSPDGGWLTINNGYRDESLLHIATELGYKIHHNKNSFVEERGDHAYHFDAHKVGKYFKKVCDTVTHIDSEVDEVILDDMTGYIKSLRLSNGTIESGDMFIDASGFNQILMKAVGGVWKSYKNNLPVNSALPFLLPYDEDEKIEPVTNAWAQRNGWCWQIPTLNRRGCGYVFCDDFVTPEQAQDELEQTLGKKIEPIRLLKFESGRQQTLWIKNCLAIGLCAAFAEPLEATSIHTTIIQLKQFVYGCIGRDMKQTCNPGQVKQYNDHIGHLYDSLKDFLVAHYTCGRKDTPFWRYIDSGETMTEFVKDIHAVCKHRSPNQSMFNKQEGSAGWPLWSYVLAGTGKLSDYVCRKELDYNNDAYIADQSYRYHIEQHDNKTKDLPDNTEYIRNAQ